MWAGVLLANMDGYFGAPSVALDGMSRQALQSVERWT